MSKLMRLTPSVILEHTNAKSRHCSRCIHISGLECSETALKGDIRTARPVVINMNGAMICARRMRSNHTIFLPYCAILTSVYLL